MEISSPMDRKILARTSVVLKMIMAVHLNDFLIFAACSFRAGHTEFTEKHVSLNPALDNAA